MSQLAPLSRFAALPAPVRAILWMVSAAFLLTCMNATVKFVTQDIHPFEVVFFRGLFGVFFLVPWMLRTGVRQAVATRRLPLYLFRAVMIFIGMSAMFWAMKLAPLAEATTIVFSRPLFATAFAVLLVGEIIGWRRWAATAVGFAGVMVAMWPGISLTDPNAGMLLALTSAVIGGFSVNLTKILSRTEHPDAMTFYFLALQVPVALVASLFVWTTPDLTTLALLLLIGLFGVIGQRCFARAFHAGDVSLVMPLDFLRLPFAALLGFIIFADVPLVWTWIGGTIIFGATCYIAQREAKRGGKGAGAGFGGG